MSGGGGTTYQTTTLPSGVENTLNRSAEVIGGIINSSQLQDLNMLGKNPQGTAGWNTWEQAAANNLGLGTQMPAGEQALYGYINYAPGYAGQTPGSYYSATGQRPGAADMALQQLTPTAERVGMTPLGYVQATGQRPLASELALQQLTPTTERAGKVSSLYYQGRPGYTSQAGNMTDLASIGMQPFIMQAYDSLQPYAAQVPGQFGQLQQEMDLRGAGILPTGTRLANSPSLAQAQQAFNTAILPQIENQAAVSGLGRSTALTNATAQAQAQYMLPVVQDELNREFQANLARYQSAQDVGLQAAMAQERGLERGVGAATQRAQMLSQTLPQTYLQAAQVLEGLGQQDLARTLQTAQAEERGTERWVQAQQQAVQVLQQQGQYDLARQLELAGAEERGTERWGQAQQQAIQVLQQQGQYDLARQLELAQAEERSIGRGTEAMIASYNPLLAMGGAQTGREQEYYNRLLGLGAQSREMEQAQLDAQYNDFLRRQALAESAIYAPFNQAIPSAFGSIARQSGGGGLFK